MVTLPEHKAIIFDLDGTLADSTHVWDGLIARWLHSQDLGVYEGVEEKVESMSLTGAARYISVLYSLPCTAQELVAQWLDLVRADYEQSIQLKPGVLAFLRRQKAQGIPMAVATSGFREASTAFLTRTGVIDLLDAVAFTDETEHNKTHPDVFLLAAQRIGAYPEDCIVFEDSCDSLRGATAAGMKVVAVYDARCRDWESFSRDAVCAIRSFEELF